jgi:hypothetical protein
MPWLPAIYAGASIARVLTLVCKLPHHYRAPGSGIPRVPRLKDLEVARVMLPCSLAERGQLLDCPNLSDHRAIAPLPVSQLLEDPDVSRVIFPRFPALYEMLVEHPTHLRSSHRV